MTTTDLARHSLRVALSFPEAESLARLFAGSRRFDPSMRHRIHVDATDLVRRVRASGQHSLMERFLTEYGLSTTEGVGLMCLAEALLRVPDADTIDELIRDKIEPSDWGAHLGRSSSSLVNASTWALMLTGHLLDDDARPRAGGCLARPDTSTGRTGGSGGRRSGNKNAWPAVCIGPGYF